MLNPITSNNSIEILGKALNASKTRMEAISNNIANIDTPGYKSYKVVFEEEMLKHKGDIESMKTTTHKLEITSGSMRVDGNNVDIEMEMANLAKNEFWYEALVTKLNSDFTRMRLVIK